MRFGFSSRLNQRHPQCIFRWATGVVPALEAIAEATAAWDSAQKRGSTLKKKKENGDTRKREKEITYFSDKSH